MESLSVRYPICVTDAPSTIHMSDSPSLPLNQILHGNCLEVLATLPDNSADLIFADPPYNLQLQQALYRPNMSKVDAVDDEWDRFDNLAAYDAFTRAWLSECRRVLKATGTIWVIGSYHNIYRVGAILQDLEYWILNDLVWVKCLAGDTELLALINGQPIVSTLKDLIRIDLAGNSIELPSYDDQGKLTWVDLTGWQKAEKARGLQLEFEDGSRVECTPVHRFPVARNGKTEMVAAQELAVGDALLQLGRFEIPRVITSQSMDEAVGELVGWYLAEGSLRGQNKGLQFSMAADERTQAEKLLETVREKFGVAGQIYVYKNALHLKFSGQFMVALMKRFVRGDGAKKKRLTREAFWHGLDFVRGILHGYLQGDGHWDKKNQRWRLGLAPNRGLITDLGVVCRLLGYRLRVSDGTMPYQRGRAEVIRGEVRENVDDRWSSVSLAELGLPARRFFNTAGRHSLAHLRDNYRFVTRKNPVAEAPLLATQVMRGDLRTVRIKNIQSTTLRTFYDLSVSGNHVFALANGLLTHNSNPMPNFRGVRFTNAHETLLWAQKCQGAPYTFNYQAMKSLNDGLQMRSDWNISLCTGKERLKVNGQKAHPTQKPEALLYRVILSSSKPGDVVLDPFFGTGTTGAVAKMLHRNFIGIEKDAGYVALARERIEAVQAGMFNDEVYRFNDKRALPRVAFGSLVERGLLQPGQTLYFGKGGQVTATILANGQIKHNGSTGSIHEVGRAIQNAPCNGWEHWYYFDDVTQVLAPIDKLREIMRAENGHAAPPSAD